MATWASMLVSMCNEFWNYWNPLPIPRHIENEFRHKNYEYDSDSYLFAKYNMKRQRKYNLPSKIYKPPNRKK
jgi:hypothetical protein